MRKVMYVAVSCLILLVALVVFLPFLSGYFFKDRYLQTLAGFKDRSVSIKVLDYQRGWFNSVIKTQATITPENNSSLQPVTITFQQNITHGPIVYDSINKRWTIAQAVLEGRFYLPDNLNLLIGNQVNKEIFQLVTLAKFGGDYVGYAISPPLNINLPNNAGKMIWNGMRGNTLIHASGTVIDRIQLTLNTGDLKIDAAPVTGFFHNMLIQQDMKRLPSGLWTGSYSVDMPGFNVNGPNNINILFEKFNLSDVFDVQEDVYNNQFQASLGRLNFPDYSIEASRIDLSINQMSAKGLVNLVNALSRLKKEELTEEQIAKYKELIPPVLTPNSVINHNIIINTSSGKFLSDGQIYWPGPAPTFDDVMNITSFKINIRASIALVNKLIEISAANEKTDYEANTPLPSDSTKPLSNLDKMNMVVDTLIQQNKVSVSIGIQLKDLIKARIPNENFSANLEEYVLKKDLTEEVASQLKVQYAQLDIANLNPDSQQTVAVAPPPPPKLAPGEEEKKAINDLLKQGYIRQDNEDYVTTITREQGVLKINGLPFPG